MSNSSLVTYTKLSKHYDSRGGTKVDKIFVHHMAGNLTVEQCGSVFQNKEVSAHYGVNGKNIGRYLDESQRAWATASPKYDKRSISIELANNGNASSNWSVSDQTISTAILLIADICKRNGIKKINYTGDLNGNLCMHKWVVATACPGAYLASKFQYIADEVNKLLNVKAEKYDGAFPSLDKKSTQNVRIGHAIRDEKGNLKNGNAGDQTGKEVLIQDYYKDFEYVARPKEKADVIAKAMEDCCKNDFIGYDQNERLTLYQEAKKVKFVISNIKTKCETDCSATVRTCLKVAGITVPSTFRTKNMKDNLEKTEKFDIFKFKKVSDLKRGDILWTPSSHTVIVLSPQTSVRKNVALSRGDSRKEQVKKLQLFLNWCMDLDLTVDGDFGTNTENAVKKFQKKYSLTVDGAFGEKSLAKAKEIKK